MWWGTCIRPLFIQLLQYTLCVSVKADLDPEDMVVLTLIISVVSLAGTSVLHASVTGIAKKEAGLSADLSYFKWNCSSHVSGSKISRLMQKGKYPQENYVQPSLYL